MTCLRAVVIICTAREICLSITAVTGYYRVKRQTGKLGKRNAKQGGSYLYITDLNKTLSEKYVETYGVFLKFSVCLYKTDNMRVLSNRQKSPLRASQCKMSSLNQPRIWQVRDQSYLWYSKLFNNFNFWFYIIHIRYHAHRHHSCAHTRTYTHTYLNTWPQTYFF